MTETPPRFAFSITARDGKARLGELAMKRGTIRTPADVEVKRYWAHVQNLQNQAFRIFGYGLYVPLLSSPLLSSRLLSSHHPPTLPPTGTSSGWRSRDATCSTSRGDC